MKTESDCRQNRHRNANSDCSAVNLLGFLFAPFLIEIVNPSASNHQADGKSDNSDNHYFFFQPSRNAELTITKGEISGTTGVTVGSNGQYAAEGTLIVNAVNDDDVTITGTGDK